MKSYGMQKAFPAVSVLNTAHMLPSILTAPCTGLGELSPLRTAACHQEDCDKLNCKAAICYVARPKTIPLLTETLL